MRAASNIVGGSDFVIFSMNNTCSNASTQFVEWKFAIICKKTAIASHVLLVVDEFVSKIEIAPLEVFSYLQ